MTLSSASVISIAEFKAAFDRDFTYGSTMDTVRDADIERAINTSVPMFNPALFGATDMQKQAALYLAAHTLVLIVRGAGGIKKKNGLSSTGSLPISSKSAGPLSVGYSAPQEVLDNPALFQFMKTEYGQMYLQLLVPNLVGYIGIAGGGTQP